LHHTQLRSCTFTIQVPHFQHGRPETVPIHIDGYGDTIISYQTWIQMEKARAQWNTPHGFKLLGDVKNPPTQRFGMGPKPPGKERWKKYRLVGDKIIDETASSALPTTALTSQMTAQLTGLRPKGR
jgi:hypothetical protein